MPAAGRRVEPARPSCREGQTPGYLAISPNGAVPAIRLDDGRTFAEFNAILWFLANGSVYLPTDRFAAARVQQWLCFEADTVQSTVATLRHWVMTGKDAGRPPALLQAKRAGSQRVLATPDRVLADAPFLAGAYTIADIAVFAYVDRADEAGIDVGGLPHLAGWLDRVRRQPGFLAQTYPYALDPYSARELA